MMEDDSSILHLSAYLLPTSISVVDVAPMANSQRITTIFDDQCRSSVSLYRYIYIIYYIYTILSIPLFHSSQDSEPKNPNKGTTLVDGKVSHSWSAVFRGSNLSNESQSEWWGSSLRMLPLIHHHRCLKIFCRFLVVYSQIWTFKKVPQKNCNQLENKHPEKITWLQ